MSYLLSFPEVLEIWIFEWNCPIFKYWQPIQMCLKYFVSQTKHSCQPPVCNLRPIPTFYREGPEAQRGWGACHSHAETGWQGGERRRETPECPEPSPGRFSLSRVVISGLPRASRLLEGNRAEDTWPHQEPLLLCSSHPELFLPAGAAAREAPCAEGRSWQVGHEERLFIYLLRNGTAVGTHFLPS